VRTFLIGAFSLVAVQARAASEIAPALAVVDRLALVIEEIDDASQGCGITKDLIEDAIRYPIVQSPLKIVPRSHAIMDVEVGTERILSGTYCITSYSVSLEALAPVTYKGKSFVGTVVLWSSNGVVNSRVADHAGRIRQEFDELGKELVVNWSQMKNHDYPYTPAPAMIPR
jgi:hypothetical protein